MPYDGRCRCSHVVLASQLVAVGLGSALVGQCLTAFTSDLVWHKRALGPIGHVHLICSHRLSRSPLGVLQLRLVLLLLLLHLLAIVITWTVSQ